MSTAKKLDEPLGPIDEVEVEYPHPDEVGTVFEPADDKHTLRKVVLIALAIAAFIAIVKMAAGRTCEDAA